MPSGLKSENQYLREMLLAMTPSIDSSPVFELVIDRISSMMGYTMFRSIAIISTTGVDFQLDTGSGPVMIPGDIGFEADSVVGLFAEINVTPGPSDELIITVIRPVSE